MVLRYLRELSSHWCGFEIILVAVHIIVASGMTSPGWPTPFHWPFLPPTSPGSRSIAQNLLHFSRTLRIYLRDKKEGKGVFTKHVDSGGFFSFFLPGAYQNNPVSP